MQAKALILSEKWKSTADQGKYDTSLLYKLKCLFMYVYNTESIL